MKNILLVVITITCILLSLIFIGYKFFLDKGIVRNETLFDNLILANEQIQQNNEYSKYLKKIEAQIQDEFNGSVKSKLENWSLYKKSADSYFFGDDGDCGSKITGNKSFIDYTKKASQGSIYKLDLPHDIYILYTPNYKNWSAKEFLSFTDDDMRICGITLIGPLYASTDKVLWFGTTCGGAGCPGHMEDQNYFLSKLIYDYFSSKIK